MSVTACWGASGESGTHEPGRQAMAQAGTLGSNTAATRRLCRHSYACAKTVFSSPPGLCARVGFMALKPQQLLFFQFSPHPPVLRVTQRARGGGQPGAVQVLHQAALR